MADYDIQKIFEDMEDYLIKSMKRTLAYHVSWEEDEGFVWEQWQAKKLREIRKFQRRNREYVAVSRKKWNGTVNAMLKHQFMEGGKKTDKEFRSVIEKGFRIGRTTPNNDWFEGENNKIQNLIKAVNGDLDNASYAALRKMDDVYRQTIFKSAMFAGNGAMTTKQAIDMATKEFLEKGIDCITYKNGAKVNIASYAAMATRTANKRAHLMGEGDRRKEWGESLVLVSQYMKCSPLCLPWQGKVYIDDVYSGGTAGDGDYPLLSVAIKGHLYHPNCRHTHSTFFEGINEVPEPLLSESGEQYKEEQRQHECRRNIRKYERLREGSLDPKNIIKYDNKLKEWKNKLNGIDKISNNDIIKTKRDGQDRANDYQEYWERASLKEQIDKYLKNPKATGVNSTGKIIYSSDETSIQVVYDVNGNYFRLQDRKIEGRKNYLDINGKQAFNVTENGKSRGRTKSEFQAATHFKNIDKR